MTPPTIRETQIRSVSHRIAFHTNSNGEKERCPLHHQFVKHRCTQSWRKPWPRPASAAATERGTIYGMSGLADVDIVASLRTGWRSLVVAGLAEGVGQPLETLVQTVTGCSTGRLDVLWRLLACGRYRDLRLNLPKRVVGGCGGRACQ